MIVDVVVPYRVTGSFHYLASDDLRDSLQLGSVIQVSFGRFSTHAFVLGFPATTNIEESRLKTIDSVVSASPLFDEKMLEFLKWVSEYYCHPLGEVVAAAVPRQHLTLVASKRRAPNQDAADREQKIADISAVGSVAPELTEEQQFALARILDPKDSRPVLLHGVTGSGKTEVYMAVLERVLAAGKSAIVLVPEIALTPQLWGRFSARFPGLVAVLHSDMTPKERYVQWERLRLREARIVVGARSAIFAPVTDLGLVVVDEEHETSYKQEDSLRYHARDIAIVRGRMSGAKVILGSATPSLESYSNAKSDKYHYVTLKKRVQERPMPRTHFVDLKDKASLHCEKVPWLSSGLARRIQATLNAGNQTLLYLNRLGFAHFLFCPDCGHTWRCKQCDVSLTYYQSPPLLKCHYCGIKRSPPSACSECKGTRMETLGVGTEQVQKTLQELFPKARVGRMDRSVIKGRDELESVLASIARREVDIVIGTQMIAKGHDFPGIALVGILLADSSLNLPDFRANERTFQIITQVAGRAGRADIPGEVVVQTVHPDHPVLRAAAEHRSVDFYSTELASRKQWGFPPFARLAMLRFQHRQPKKVEDFSLEMAQRLRQVIEKKALECTILGPAEAPLNKLKNMYRWQCLLKSHSVVTLRELIFYANHFAEEKKSSVQIAFDIDPISAM